MEGMKPSDILLKARDVMIERGHVKNNLYDDEGHVCLVGACLVARREGEEYDGKFFWTYPEYKTLQRLLGMAPDTWNDRPETTEAMALGALYDAAMLAKEAGE